MLFVPDLEVALAWYLALGLQLLSRKPTGQEAEPFETAWLRFPDGKCEPELHNQPTRQFTDLVVQVKDVQCLYRQLQHQTGLGWLQSPHPTEQGWEAVVRAPD